MLLHKLKAGSITNKLILLSLIMSCACVCSACSQTSSILNNTSDMPKQANADTETVVLKTLLNEEVPTAALDASGTRDNTPVCYVPTASGVTVYSNALAEIDASNTAKGYIMVNYKGTNQKVKLQITGSNGVTYTYTLGGG